MTRAWFGLFGSPFAWVVQLLVDYALVAHACYPGHAPLGAPAFGGVRAVALAIAALTVATAIAALLAARHDWDALRVAHAGDGAPVAGHGRRRFMALAGLCTGTVFLFAIVMNVLPLLVSPLCAGTT